MEVDLKGRVRLTPERALVAKRTAVIADLHLGFELVMRNAGVAFPRAQLKLIKERLERLFERKVKELVVAGDLKHEFSSAVEWKDVEEFVEFVLSKGVDLVVVRGNHDNYLAPMLRKFGIDLLDSYEVGEIVIAHGHRDVEANIIGHEHPSVKLRVRGILYSFPCFLRFPSLIVLPAFSPLLSGSDVLSLERFLSPVIKYRPEEAEVYAVYDEDDGCVYSLGRVSNITSILGNAPG